MGKCARCGYDCDESQQMCCFCAHKPFDSVVVPVDEKTKEVREQIIVENLDKLRGLTWDWFTLIDQVLHERDVLSKIDSVNYPLMDKFKGDLLVMRFHAKQVQTTMNEIK